MIYDASMGAKNSFSETKNRPRTEDLVEPGRAPGPCVGNGVLKPFLLFFIYHGNQDRRARDMNLLPCKTHTVPLFTMKATQKVLFLRITIVEKKDDTSTVCVCHNSLDWSRTFKESVSPISSYTVLGFWEYHLAYLSVFSCLNLEPLSLA